MEALGKVVLKENTQVWRNAEEIVVKIKSVENAHRPKMWVRPEK